MAKKKPPRPLNPLSQLPFDLGSMHPGFRRDRYWGMFKLNVITPEKGLKFDSKKIIAKKLKYVCSSDIKPIAASVLLKLKLKAGRLKAEGFTATKLKKIGLSALTLATIGFTYAELVKAKFPKKVLDKIIFGHY